MRRGPCQIWFPLTFTQKESQAQFTLWVACNIVFQGNVLYLSWPQRLSLGKTAKWLWSQCPWNTTVPIHYPEAVCTRICNQVIGDWKSAGNSSRGSLIRGRSIQRTYVDMAGGEQMEGQYISRGRDKSRRIREALAFSHRDWVWRSSSRVGMGVSGWGFGQIRQTDWGRC